MLCSSEISCITFRIYFINFGMNHKSPEILKLTQQHPDCICQEVVNNLTNTHSH